MYYSVEEVFTAYSDCRRRKRNSDSVIGFEANLAENIRELTSDLNNGRYYIGTSMCFAVLNPKPREVWAGSFRDRIAHHVSYNRIGERFTRSFSANSCACIKNRGTLYGSKRLEGFIRSGTENWSREFYFLQMDLSNFFVSIQKDIVFELLKQKIEKTEDLDLAGQILYHDPTQDYIISGNPKNLKLVPPHKSLFNTPSFMGLAIGNLSSQFYANIKLNVLDQFVDHKIKPSGYVRYVDDFILVDRDINKLRAAKDEIEQMLWSRLLLLPNPSKTKLDSVHGGVDFVGRVILPHRTIPRKTLANNAFSKLKNGTATAEGLTSTIGLMRKSNSYNLRRRLCGEAIKNGYSVNADMTRVTGYARR